MSKPDFCDWWTPERIMAENANWQEQKIWKFVAPYVIGVAEEFKCRSIVEVGCGAGYLGRELCDQLPGLDYVGGDASSKIIDLARTQCPDQKFVHANIRTHQYPIRDMVISFAVLKHFPVSDWREILRRILALGQYAVLDAGIRVGALPSIDDGPDYNHIWVCEDELREEFAAANLDLRILFQLPVPHSIEGTELWYIAGIPK